MADENAWGHSSWVETLKQRLEEAEVKRHQGAWLEMDRPPSVAPSPSPTAGRALWLHISERHPPSGQDGKNRNFRRGEGPWDKPRIPAISMRRRTPGNPSNARSCAARRLRRFGYHGTGAADTELDLDAVTDPRNGLKKAIST